jgi:type VI secretion system protein ImpA
MPQPDAILVPIPGDNPSGRDLRFAPIYDEIKEARRQDDELNQGAWQHERKTADHGLVIRLIEEALSNQTKDLQLAAWLTEALLKKQFFGGLRDGLEVCRGLLETFWDTLYPELDDGDTEFRAAPLEWIGTKFEVFIKSAPLCAAGHDFFKYKESRSIEYEDQAKDKDKKAAREAAIKAGKLTPEAFDKAFGETQKPFYAQAEKDLDASLAALSALDRTCREKFGESSAPSFMKVRGALQDVRAVVHGFLQKKRETDPDPVEDTPVADAATGETSSPAESESPSAGTVAGGGTAMMVQAPEEPADRRDAIASVVATAAFLRRREPKSPASYLMLRGLRWGELRAAVESGDAGKLEAPPTDLRRLIKKLAIERKWKDLIETAETAMGLPCSRAWLDLQRMVVEACNALGSDYQLIAMAIQSELRALVRDVPALLDLTLMDDTPAANGETKAWLKSLSEEPQSASPKLPGTALGLDGNGNGWQQKFVDSYELAVQALRAGQEQKAFEIVHSEIQKQRSGRGRFERRLQLVQLCVSTGKEALMQPILDDLMAAVENHKLEEWEDREKLAAALATILKASKKIQGDAKEKQKLFERICRLDPVQALTVG